MSNAIADASETLVTLLRTGLGVDNEQIALVSPADAVTADVRVGLFLYSITPVPELRNEPETARTATGRVVPSLPLALEYLLTAYPRRDSTDTPTDRALEAQALLGAAIRVLHENPVLTGSRLVGQIPRDEQLRVTLQPITVEDLARIWSLFANTAYQPSVSYRLSPVRIASA